MGNVEQKSIYERVKNVGNREGRETFVPKFSKRLEKSSRCSQKRTEASIRNTIKSTDEFGQKGYEVEDKILYIGDCSNEGDFERVQRNLARAIKVQDELYELKKKQPVLSIKYYERSLN